MLSAIRRSWSFLRLQRVADRDVVLDVRHHGEDAAHVSADGAIGEQRDADPAQLAGRLALATLERHLFAVERALDELVHLGERSGDQAVHRAAEQVVRIGSDPVAERLVGESDLELSIEMDDRRSDAIGDEAQPVLAPARFELEPLELIDVGIRDEETPDVAVGGAVRIVVDPDPHRRPPGHGQLPLEPGPLAAQRGFDIGFEERILVAAGDLLDLVADQLGNRQPGPFDERLVDEAIAPAAVDVGNRQAERIELALRKRRQAVRAGAIGRLSGHRRHPEPG